MFRRNGSDDVTTAMNMPLLLKLRSSVYYITLVTGMGLFTDVCLYPLFTPAIPFRLEALGFQNIPSLTGWLAAAYAGGLVVATFPFAWLGSRYRGKRNLLLGALVLMALSILFFLFAPNYAGMVSARVLQGASGAGIWTIGLALVADNCPSTMLGKCMGIAMIGDSFGTAVGQPVGGVLYTRLGWNAPAIFALALVGLDLILRILVVEKHEIAKWAPATSTAAGEMDDDLKTVDTAPTDPASDKLQHNTTAAIKFLLFDLRALVPLMVSFLNGLIFSGIYNTALVLRLSQRYGLDAEGAGLAYFAVAIPSSIISPAAGWLTDRFGCRILSTLCCAGFIPALCSLMIEQLPLPAFIALLVLCGLCSGLINSPVMVWLAHVSSTSNGVCGTSYAYGGFNLTFSLAAFIGPIVAGQILDTYGIPNGFRIQIGITAAISLIMAPLTWIYMQKEPDFCQDSAIPTTSNDCNRKSECPSPATSTSNDRNST